MKTKPYLVLLATLAFVASPFLVSDFAGFDPNLYPVPQIDPPVQPAGYAFAIWGVIYFWLIIHAFFGALKRRLSPAWNTSRWPLFASLLIGSSWLWVATKSPVWATILIFAMLALALAALFRIPPSIDRWVLQTPVAIYAGWLSAASCASLGLLGAGWGIGLEETGWAYASLTVALIIGATVQVRVPHAPEYGLAVIWALVAIAIKNWGVQPGVAAAAIAASMAMAGLAYSGSTRR